jgi:hypothetical protein
MRHRAFRTASRRLAFVAAMAATTLAAAACSDDNVGPQATRMYDQVQRLGNPLVSEVLLAKRSHAQHGTIGPAEDAAMIGVEFRAFIANVAGRNATVQNTLASVLLPDMMIVETGRDPSTAGYLSWALANGWGGRTLSDDILDASTMAVFGSLLDPNNVSPGLTTDNVGSDDTFSPTFPYLKAPN